ncbi:carboxylesterase/lipase family protein [Novosphingobium sp. KACC 22771]|uniref:carboxylesterase/lipase family protein n=1 Tax=Novosphingobium sp. KACC 22771 TaxID=3025670 RepID=UPI002365625C|nr:carboxylesterase family protein [Novosphingobium sp. KACC 22771]WDF75146.1 carboxylesterase family protein [Novosphingobium sp. KACC 22771]
MSIVHKFGLAMLAAALGSSALAGPTVQVAQGKVEGIVKDGVEAYRAIPYAQAPEGNLRWRAPEPAQSWPGVRDASRAGPACYQADGGAGWGPYTAEFIAPGPFAEDCLTANIWTPARKTGRLPVFVFIHGGGFGGGGANVPIYDGATLAKRGVVVVTIQYRVGVFGFLAHPALSAESPIHSSGNYGLLDQIEAIKWVKANIARFGGDAANITIAGESAGAASVSHLVVSPLAKGLFAKAVAFSGASMGVPVPPLREGEAVGVKLAEDLGKSTPDELRNVSAAQLVERTRAIPDPGGKAPPLLFVPHVDGAVVLYDPSIGDRPIASNVAIMTGYNAAEMVDFSIDTPEKFETAVRARYGDFADRLLRLYPHATRAEAEASNLLMARDRYMSGVLIWAKARQKTSGQTVFDYLYDHPYPPAPQGKAYGAFHSSQIPYIFGNLGLGNRHFSAGDAKISRQWQDLLIAFMRKGNPSGPNGAWPPASQTKGIKAMVIGDHPGFAPVISSTERFEAFRDYARQGGVLGLM